MKKITYIIGAGACVGTKEKPIIPVVKNFPEGMKKICDMIYSRGSKENYLTYAEKNVFNHFIEMFRKVIDESSKHSSIDTYARKLFLQSSSTELSDTKKILSSYLILQQAYNGLDLRYDSFFAALLNSGKDQLLLPNNISIVSWNYDYQIELSMFNFHKNATPTSKIDEMLNVIPRDDYKKKDGFSLIKLNGTAYGSINDKTNFNRTIFKSSFLPDKIYDNTNYLSEEQFLIKTVLQYYNSVSDTGIHFAWEDDFIPDDTRKKAIEATKDTNILVVIGYSFPVFNREIDRQIINSMEYLKKVYFQFPKDDIDSVVERFRAIKDFTKMKSYKEGTFIEKIISTDDFFIPYEYGIPDEQPLPMFKTGE